jgi:hypothetical protein
MRSFLIAALAAAGLTMAVTSGVYAAPIAPIGKAAQAIDASTLLITATTTVIIIAAAGGTTVIGTAAGDETRGRVGSAAHWSWRGLTGIIPRSDRCRQRRRR